jgi:diguanylate cyclase (GGDEF)-like protein
MEENIMHHDVTSKNKLQFKKRKNIYLTPKNFLLFFILLMLPRIIQKIFHSHDLFFDGYFTHILDIMLLLTVSFTLFYFLKKVENSILKLEQAANRDDLTGLSNRRMLNDYLKNSLARCERNNRELAILFLDLDRFKFINDTLGHDEGDHLLKQVTERLVKSVRKGDIVARQGGDEFIILLEEIDRNQVKEVAERIIESFKSPFLLHNEEYYLTTSIGISLYPQDEGDSQTLIKNADSAMYLAKRCGKNNYQFFINEPQAILERKMKLEQAIRKALDKNEFILHYQPKVNLETGEIYGVEALLRWKHPELGMIYPLEFIPIAEDTGMIIPIGTWVLNEACRQSKRWLNKGIRIKMAVNVSAIQFQENIFIKKVEDALNENNLLPEYLGLEITESVMQNINQSSAIIHELKRIGVKVAIDDFGTGYSSLSVLSQLPIDLIKIDKSFVNDILTNSNAASLIKIIVDLSRNLNFGLVAEGIENEQQAEFLMQNGCSYGQGYLYSPPLSEAELESLLKK